MRKIAMMVLFLFSAGWIGWSCGNSPTSANSSVGTTDNTERSIRKIVPNTSVQTLVGPSLSSPGGIAVDASGDVFFSDQASNVIYEHVP